MSSFFYNESYWARYCSSSSFWAMAYGFSKSIPWSFFAFIMRRVSYFCRTASRSFTSLRFDERSINLLYSVSYFFVVNANLVLRFLSSVSILGPLVYSTLTCLSSYLSIYFVPCSSFALSFYSFLILPAWPSQVFSICSRYALSMSFSYFLPIMPSSFSIYCYYFSDVFICSKMLKIIAAAFFSKSSSCYYASSFRSWDSLAVYEAPCYLLSLVKHSLRLFSKVFK